MIEKTYVSIRSAVRALIEKVIVCLLLPSILSCSTSLPKHKNIQNNVSPKELLYVQARLNACTIIRFINNLHDYEKRFQISTPSAFDISSALSINESMTKLYGQFGTAVTARYPSQTRLFSSYKYNYGQLYMAVLNYITNHLRSIYSQIPQGDRRWIASVKSDLMLEALMVACHELSRAGENYVTDTFTILDLVSQFANQTDPAYAILALKLTQTFFDPPKGIRPDSEWYTPNKAQVLVNFLENNYTEIDRRLISSQDIQRIVCAINFFSVYRFLIIPIGDVSFQKNPYKFKLRPKDEQTFFFYTIYAYAPRLISIRPPASTKNLGQKGEISFDFKTGRIVLYY